MPGPASRAIAGFGWLGGPLVWSAHFLVVYASESLICSRGLGTGTHMTLVIAATLIAVGLIAAIVANRWGQARADGGAGFLVRAGLALDGLSLLAIGWATLAALMLPACHDVA